MTVELPVVLGLLTLLLGMGTLLAPIIKLHSRLDLLDYRLNQQSQAVQQLGRELREWQEKLMKP